MSNNKYVIGIDLGTTNSTLSFGAFPDALQASFLINQFPIPQVQKAFEVQTAFSLPSFIYHPLHQEFESKMASVPWSPDCPFTIGAFARDRGAELPNRVISSAKSWLSHPSIDRRERLLPIESEEKSSQMSPLEACAEILKHLKNSWDFSKPEALFNEQAILVTVPASFDPSARQLVQEAAEIAEYPNIILLEEPLAAFYSWLHTHSEDWRKILKIGDLILVVDIGGGTTDFSLISVAEEQGSLQLKREAVGSHLLLGGDNIDLGLAYLLKQRLEEQGNTIDSWQLQSLMHQAREAKEKLLSNSGLPSIELTVLGRGSRLIGNTLKLSLSQKEVSKFILEGFLPLVKPEEQSPSERSYGFQQIGLPYAKDPRISCQLAKFLSMTGETNTSGLFQSEFLLPTMVLFNGGTLKASLLRDQIMLQLNQWAQIFKKPPIKELADPDYDYAVSRGAVYYGYARENHGIRVRSGTSRSYFIGIEEALPAVPGITPPLRAVCIVPYGLEEGEERELEHQEFALVLGEMAVFRFFSRSAPTLSNGEEARLGTVIRNWKEDLLELHPIETILDKNENDEKNVRVKLKTKVTEIGVLELWCESDEGKKWKLEFDLRRA